MRRVLKTFMAVMLSVIMICSSFHVWSYGATKEEIWDGITKTQPLLKDDVYQITNGAELAWLSDYVNEGNTAIKAELQADINLGSQQWIPIGSSAKKYTGTFDGNGYAIHNLAINSETNYLGLFGYLGAGATITDFYLDGNIDSVYESNGGFAGGVAGYATGSSSKPVCITKVRNNCNVTVKGSSYGSYAGGIVGYSGTNVKIDKCSNSATIMGTQKAVGGIAGSGKSISNCYNAGHISGSVSVGGIAGLCSTDEIINCYNNGYIKGSNYVGGITALSSKTVVVIRNCYNTGMIEAMAADGIKDDIVAAPLAKVENCYRVNVANDSYYHYGQLVTEDELKSAADELGNAFAVNVHSEYQFGYPILMWELEEDSFQNLETKEITAVTVADGTASLASVKFGTQMSNKMYKIMGFADEVILNTGNGQLSVPATWKSETYNENVAAAYTFIPVYQLPAGAVLDSDALIQTSQVVVREKGAKAPYVTSVELNHKENTQITVKYGRKELGLPEVVKAVVDGVEKQVYVEWEMEEGFDTTIPGSYEAKAYFPEEYELEKDVTMPVMTVNVKEQGFLSELKFSAVKNDSYYEMTPAFDETIKEYTVYVPDSKSTFYCETILDESVGTGTIEATYTSTSDKETVKSITSGEIWNLAQVVRAGNANNTANDNIVSIQVKDSTENIQTYVIHVRRTRSLKSMKLWLNGTDLISEPEFANNIFEYEVNVPDSANEVTLLTEATAMDSRITVTSDAVSGEIGANTDGNFDISLSDDILTNVKIHVSGETEGGAQDYHVKIKKLRTAVVDFQVSPQAVVVVKDQYHERIFEEEDGSFHLFEGESYTYSVSKNGYISVKDTFTAETGTRIVDLEPASENTEIPKDMIAQWPNFAKNPENNAIVSAKTPIQATGAALYWSTKLGDGYGGQATGAPLIVDGCMIVTAKDKIYKIDRFTGEVLKVRNMSGASSFSIVPPTYAEGMIFVGLANGTIQAFHAETLESLWVFRDEWKGQPNCPIKYHDGYIYTGFWNSETKNANFVCVSVTDEDITQTNEEKVSAWTYTQPGGFYWAGAYVCDDYVLVGTDDGAEGYTQQSSNLLSLNRETGKVMDQITGLNGDIRSSVCYDEVTDRYYITTKGGSFYGFSVNEDGTFKRDETGLKGYDLREISLGGMSTSTPVVYNGRAYVGVAGISQFTADSGHGVEVLDLTSWCVAYKAETKGYPQTSGLLTTAYETSEDGYVYVYFIDNYTPGEVRYIKDKPGITEVLEPYVESSGGTTKSYAPILFTPSEAQAQYAICTPIVDEYGTFYFKNDSAYMMALGSNIERIEVAKQPDKTVYEQGEDFEASGMAVHAILSNGLERDITEYVEIISGEALTEGRREVSIRYSDVQYQDVEQSINGVNVHASHVKLQPLYTAVKITVGKEVPESPQPSCSNLPDVSETPTSTASQAPEVSKEPAPTDTMYPNNSPQPGKKPVINVVLGDANGDEKVSLEDAQLVLKVALKISVLDDKQKVAADVKKDEKITLEDAQLILKAALKIIKLEE